jgi:hypothetical protein
MIPIQQIFLIIAAPTKVRFFFLIWTVPLLVKTELYYGSHTPVNPESFLLPSLEKRRKMGETHNDWTSFHPIFESHLPCSTATGDNIAGPSQDGHQDEILSKLIDSRSCLLI